MVNCHQGEQQRFKFKIDRSWRSSLERQLMESLQIDNEHGSLLNSRTEYGANSIPRIVAQQPGETNGSNNNCNSQGRRPRDLSQNDLQETNRVKRQRVMTGVEHEAQPHAAHHHGDDGPRMMEDSNLASQNVNARANNGIKMYFRSLNKRA